ncbi:MAG: family N-acetyltransferase [Myxococcaceae bacterium]|nr:family N-acetyltransferase [Myxococcaceae bacterium]
MALKIRPYRAEDRERVRSICFDTGLMGEPVADQYGDRESFADLFTAYYTDHEPQHCFVVDADGAVVGYLLGTLDTRRVPTKESIIASHMLRRALPLRPRMAQFIARSARDAAADALARVRPELADLSRFPAHTHFNLLPEARMAPIAAGLYRAFFQVAKRAGCPGIHGEVFAENTRAAALHQAMGFARQGEPTPVPGMRSASGERLHLQLWTRAL